MKKLALALMVVGSTASTANAQVVITEIQPNPVGSDNAEWIEFQNLGTTTVDISDWTFHEFTASGSAGDWTFPLGTTLAPDQVLLVVKDSSIFALRSMLEWGNVDADFELAIPADDPMVANLMGPSAFGLNQTDDAVVLMDDMGMYVDGVEYGIDRVEVPGAPVLFWPTQSNINEGLSIQRIALGGSGSDTDFTVTAMSNAGIGYQVGVGTPPMIIDPRREPAQWAYGESATMTATIADMDGVAGGVFHVAVATAVSGDADTAYAAITAQRSGNNLFFVTGTVNSVAAGLNFAEPATFHDQYVRWFIEGTDSRGAVAIVPTGAVSTADNANYYWENVLPSTSVFTIAEAREQDAVTEIPLWDGHSVRVEGVVLTDQRAFSDVAANFFIADKTSLDAIRVFDDVLNPVEVMPGDVVRVTGKIGVYRGVRQIGQDERIGQSNFRGYEITVEVIGTDTVPVKTVSIATLLANAEAYESQLVEIPNVTLVPGPNGEPVPGTFASESTVYIDDGAMLPVRIFSNTDLVGRMAPDEVFTLRGIFSQFTMTGGLGGYQLQPTAAADILPEMPDVDAGVVDSGMTRDGGPVDPNRDGGPVDPNRDGGTVDPNRDGGSARDSGVPKGSEEEERKGGCGCRATDTKAEGGAALGMLLVLGLLSRRRRTATARNQE